MSLQIVKYRNYGRTMNGGEKTPDVKGVIIGHDDDDVKYNEPYL